MWKRQDFSFGKIQQRFLFVLKICRTDKEIIAVISYQFLGNFKYARTLPFTGEMASNETVYGNMTSSVTSVETGASEGGPSSDSHAVMNEKVQAIAGSVYEEFERMISKYDQDVVKNLMPIMVNVLESLDFAYTETQELEVECELLKEDNEQLVTQYEREKQLRKSSEQKALEIEDGYEGERKEAGVKIESLTSIVKMFELKTKNFQDQSKSC